jgi:putative hydrolase of the HAD superfamily
VLSDRGRVRCRAVFLDGGGVLVLPHGDLVRAALRGIGVEIDAAAVPSAHYRAVRTLDRRTEEGTPDGYLSAFCGALGVPAARLQAAVSALSQLGDRARSGQILWSQPTRHARKTIDALRAAGIAVLVVTNSDGHAAENLRDAGVCQANVGRGAMVTDVVDSGLVGSAKPDPGIFRVALQRVDVEPSAVVHVGDMVTTDVIGARAAGSSRYTSTPTATVAPATTVTSVVWARSGTTSSRGTGVGIQYALPDDAEHAAHERVDSAEERVRAGGQARGRAPTHSS